MQLFVYGWWEWNDMRMEWIDKNKEKLKKR